MTNKDAIKEAEVQIDVYENMILYNKDFEPKNDNSNYERKIEFMRLVIEALKKADKYKWHDLRKNPDDLPEADEYGKSDYVLVMIGTPEWDHCELVYYNHNRDMWSSLYEQNVFAWRYIEPFKEEEEKCVSD